MTRDSETALVTGFPAFTARRMTRKLLEGKDAGRLYLLVRPKFRIAAEEFLAGLAAPASDGGLGRDVRERVVLLEGDVVDMDLGLAGAEYRALAEEVTSIYHLAAIYFPGVKREVAERVNIEGTRSILELAEECKRLRRLSYFSTAQVSGDRTGVVLEEELDEKQRFHNVYEETKFRAEKLVQEAARRLPITVFRPGLIVGDSRTGEIDKFDGPYYLTVLIVASPLDVHLPLPGRGSAPLHLVPIDFVIDAAHTLAHDPRAVGKTFHLTDPSPFSARYVYELIARHAERKPPRGTIPAALARAVLKAPGLEKLARAPLHFLESLNQVVLYNNRNTLALLDDTDVRCPPIDTYVQNLVRYVKDVHDARRKKLEEETFDPFD
jgi:thioester reductase-like protein